MLKNTFLLDFIALYDRLWSYKLLKESETLVILGVTGLMLLSWQHICHFCRYGLYFFLVDSLNPFVPSAPFLYPFSTLQFSDVFGG